MTDWISADDRLKNSSFYSKLCHQPRLALRTLDVSWRLKIKTLMCKENKTKSVKIGFFFCKWRQGVKLLNMSIWGRIKSGRPTCRCYCVLSRPIELLLYSNTQLCIIRFIRGLKSTVMLQFLTLDLLEITRLCVSKSVCVLVCVCVCVCAFPRDCDCVQ